MSVLLLLIILFFLILIHELGHFLAARKFKVTVEEFAIGFPPRALKLFTWGGTLFTLNWLPVGGYVKMLGEDSPSDEEVPAKVKAKASTTWGPFYTKSVFARLVIIYAGAAMNFVFGVLAFAMVFSFAGIPWLVTSETVSEIAHSTALNQLEIGGVRVPVHSAVEAEHILNTFEQQVRLAAIAPDSPAAQANLQPNTQLLSVGTPEQQIPVTSEQQVVEFVGAHLGQSITVVTSLSCEGVVCPGQVPHTVTLRSADQVPEGQGSLGVAFDQMTAGFYPWYHMVWRGVAIGLQQAFWLGWQIILFFGILVRTLLTQLGLPTGISSIVGIAYDTQKSGVLSHGWVSILNFAGSLSINLAILNIMPIPALDGGRAVFIVLEKILGRHRTASIEANANQWGFIGLIGLILIITARDILHIVQDLRS